MSITTINPGTLGQACYSWATRLHDGGEGYGFVAFSPSVAPHAQWFEESTKDECGYVGSASLTAEERAVYAPVGRVVIGDGLAVAYRKVDAGRDAGGRIGRYIVHFLVGSASVLTLSTVLTISPERWLSAADVPLDGQLDLPDRLASSLIANRGEARTVTDDANTADVEADLLRLARSGRLDVSDWTTSRLRALLCCAPSWVDEQATLKPTWQAAGASLQLVSDDRAHADWIPHAAGTRAPADLGDLATAVDGRTSLSAIATALTSGEDENTLASGQSNERSERLPQALERWLGAPAESLPLDVRSVLLDAPERTLESLAALGLALPGGRRANRLALQLLRGLPDDTDPEVVAAVLPDDEEGQTAYTASAPTATVLSALLRRSVKTGEPASITLSKPPPPGVLAEVLQRAEQEQLLEQLAAAVRRSSLADGSFARFVIAATDIDRQLVFGVVLPLAARSDAELLGLVSCAPHAFTDWLACPAPYAEALSALLAKDSRIAVWQRVSALLSRWSRKQPVVEHDAHPGSAEAEVLTENPA